MKTTLSVLAAFLLISTSTAALAESAAVPSAGQPANYELSLQSLEATNGAVLEVKAGGVEEVKDGLALGALIVLVAALALSAQ